MRLWRMLTGDDAGGFAWQRLYRRRISDAADPPDRRLPGRRSDRFRRAPACRKVKGTLGQSVLIENKAGANAAIGADYVAKSEPDGYTLFFTTIGAVAMNPHMRADLPYDPVRDFAPVSRMVVTKGGAGRQRQVADQDGEAIWSSWPSRRTAACRWLRPASAACRISRLNCSSSRPA